VSLKIWRSGCQHLNLFPGKVSPVANLLRAGQRKRASERARASKRERERERRSERRRERGEEGRSRERVCASRCVLPRGVLQERACKSRDTFDFLNSRLPSVCREGRGKGVDGIVIFHSGGPATGCLDICQADRRSPSAEKPVIIINYAAASRKRARARASAGRERRGDTPRESEIERLRRRDS